MVGVGGGGRSSKRRGWRQRVFGARGPGAEGRHLCKTGWSCGHGLSQVQRRHSWPSGLREHLQTANPSIVWRVKIMVSCRSFLKPLRGLGFRRDCGGLADEKRYASVLHSLNVLRTAPGPDGW